MPLKKLDPHFTFEVKVIQSPESSCLGGFAGQFAHVGGAEAKTNSPQLELGLSLGKSCPYKLNFSFCVTVMFVIYSVDKCGRNTIQNKLVQNRKFNVKYSDLIGQAGGQNMFFLYCFHRLALAKLGRVSAINLNPLIINQEFSFSKYFSILVLLGRFRYCLCG